MIDPFADPPRRRPLGSAIHRLVVSVVLVAVMSGTGLAQESPVEVVDRPATATPPVHHHAAPVAKKHHRKSKAHRKHKAKRKARKARKSHKHHRRTHRHHKAKPAPAAK